MSIRGRGMRIASVAIAGVNLREGAGGCQTLRQESELYHDLLAAVQERLSWPTDDAYPSWLRCSIRIRGGYGWWSISRSDGAGIADRLRELSEGTGRGSNERPDDGRMKSSRTRDGRSVTGRRRRESWGKRTAGVDTDFEHRGVSQLPRVGMDRTPQKGGGPGAAARWALEAKARLSCSAASPAPAAPTLRGPLPPPSPRPRQSRPRLLQ